jgi:hypothetical protein
MEKLRMRELVPPMWPPDSFTMEEARQAIREVEAEDEARREARRKRSRAASKKLAQDGGEDP